MNRVSIFQLFLGLFVVQTGVVYISIQNVLINQGKRDTTLIFILATIIYFFILILYNRLHRFFFLNSVLKYVYVLYWLLHILSFVVYLTYIMKAWILTNTPTLVIIVPILLVCYYAVISRAETTINLPIILVPLLVLFLISLLRVVPELRVEQLFPLFHSSKEQWLRTFMHAWYAFVGAELFLVFRKYIGEKLTTKAIFIYVSILGAMHFVAIIVTLLFFPVEELKIVTEPILYILNAQEVTFLKRLDIFFIYIWLFWSITAMMYYLLAIKNVLKMDQKKGAKGIWATILSAIAIIASYMINIRVIDWNKSYLIYFVIVFTFLLPIGIIIFNKVKGKTCDIDTSS